MEIYQREDAYYPNKQLREEVQSKLFFESFMHHYTNNDTYRKYCMAKSISIEDIKNSHRNIPLIPSTLFKKHTIRTHTGEKTVKKCLSSGTQGSVSLVERDNTTMERFLGSVRNMIDNVYGIEDAMVFNLGPSSDEAADVWFAYVMSVIDMVFPTINYVRNDVFCVEECVEDIAKYASAYKEIVIIGAPVMLMNFYKFLEDNNISFPFGDKVFIVTAGGWKKFQNRSVSKQDLKRMAKKYFEGISEESIRDAFNMVELNTVIPECECGSKHVPLWVDAYTVDLDTYEIAERGKEGLLVFLDASAGSYPCFVMSGDLGKVTYIDNCPCGRKGVCIEITRRINTIESRGCALKMEKKYLNNPANQYNLN